MCCMATTPKTLEERIAAYRSAIFDMEELSARYLEARAAGMAAMRLDLKLTEAIASVRRTERALDKARRKASV